MYLKIVCLRGQSLKCGWEFRFKIRLWWYSNDSDLCVWGGCVYVVCWLYVELKNRGIKICLWNDNMLAKGTLLLRSFWEISTKQLLCMLVSLLKYSILFNSRIPQVLQLRRSIIVRKQSWETQIWLRNLSLISKDFHLLLCPCTIILEKEN